MNEIRFISGIAAMNNYLHGIKEEVSDQLEARNINASGSLDRSNRTAVYSDGYTTVGELMALGHWKTAGSGSPPGTRVGFLTLAQWAIDKGLTSSQSQAERIGGLVSAKIEQKGSKDHRERNPNVYTEAIKKAEPKVPKVINAFVLDVARPIRSAFNALR